MSQTNYIEVTGKTKLEGIVNIPGAKNATLPMMCAALLTDEVCEFHNVPEISDIAILLEVFEFLGAKISRNLETKIITIQAKNIDPEKLEHCEELKKLRATILLLGPLLARFGKATIVQPGGDIIGARPNNIHTDGLQEFGAKLLQNDRKLSLEFKNDKLKNKRLLLPEASVTGTENLAIFLAGIADTAEMYFTAAEPHVCATLRMLQTMGAKIEGIGTHHLKITGTKKLKGGIFKIPPDGILVGTYAIAGLITQGTLEINNVNHKELFSFYGIIKRLGANFEINENQLKILPSPNLTGGVKVQTAIYPGFSTDIQSPMGLLLTQCTGESIIFETLFENRLAYLYELEKMGAKIEILNAHQAKITGKINFKGAEVQSWDLRAGATVVLAGLIAEGTTKVTNIQYIDRGYEHFVENLQRLGANIKRV